MSGMGTLLFFCHRRACAQLSGLQRRLRGVVIAATGFNGQGINPNLSVALGGIIACGLVYTLTGLVVMKVGTRWIERMMPPSSPGRW